MIPARPRAQETRAWNLLTQQTQLVHVSKSEIPFRPAQTTTSTMSTLTFDPVTKNFTVTPGSTDAWDDNESAEYAREVDQLNLLAKQLVATTADVPPPGNQISGNLTKQVDKLRETAARESKQGKHAEALKLLTMALDMALRRALWESVQYQISQIVIILSDRCDAFIKLNKWADAYGDAHILTTIQPNEWSNFYRKARCLRRIEQYGEARANLNTALEFAKNDRKAAQKVNEEIKALDDLTA